MATNQQEMDIMATFEKHYPGQSEFTIHRYFAPGRVNLIGEHTDYNGGYVFPAALTLGTNMLVRLRNDHQVFMASTNFEQTVSFTLDELTYKAEDDWGNYPKGVLAELKHLDIPLRGAEVLFHGTLPNGAGLSSSASIGMVTAYAFSELFKACLSRVELAQLCQRMENDFIGVNTGIMDQFAVGLGQENHALFIDTNSLEYEAVPLELRGYKLVITNTNKQRALADSKYNERRQECEQGLAMLKKGKENLTHLGQLSQSELDSLSTHIHDEVILKRIRHVVSEDERVLQATKALKENDIHRFGRLMAASHVSLRDDYEVTGKELDALFNAQKEAPGCIGTRMTGAGFGGCTISIVEESQVESFTTYVQPRYEQETGLTPSFYVCEVGDGVKEL